MRKLLLVAFVALFTFQTNAQEIKFESEVLDYGKIKKDSDGTRFFKFKNVGDAPLIIKQAVGSGPVIAEPPVKPIFPGEKGVIKVRYNTFKSGNFSKPVTVRSNAKNKPRIVLTIKGYVYE